MLKLMTKDNKFLNVDDIEIKENRKLFAVDAFNLIINKSKYIKKGINKEDIFFIMGSDNYAKMPKWKGYNEIKDKYNYIIIDRDKKDISSTDIRNLIKNNNNNVLKYISQNVYKYIIKNNLYKI